jgi:hypothetical protein
MCLLFCTAEQYDQQQAGVKYRSTNPAAFLTALSPAAQGQAPLTVEPASPLGRQELPGAPGRGRPRGGGPE